MRAGVAISAFTLTPVLSLEGRGRTIPRSDQTRFWVWFFHGNMVEKGFTIWMEEEP